MTCIDHYASSEAFYLCRCQDCDFLFTQDFPVEAEIGKYYETPDYISHSDTKKGLMNKAYHWVRGYMLGRKARLVAREAHRKEGRLLDIGTGTGYFADTMKRRGWQVEAVEKNAQARAFAKEHFGLDVKPDTALQDFAPGSFDVIMELTNKVVQEKHLTAMMVTHNLRYAVEYGSRLIMMDKGHIVLDKAGEEKVNTKVDDILDIFTKISIECGN